MNKKNTQKSKVEVKKEALNLNKIGDDEIIRLFSESFEKNVARFNEITEFECNCVRQANKSDVEIEVTIVGMAGSPTVDSFKNNKVKDAERIVVENERNKVASFVLDSKGTVSLNSNDYMIVYRNE